MKSILKSIIITGLFAFSQQIVFAQDADKTVTLTVTGQGKTIDEAKTNALRSAIEQAFGAFISSNTTILNDSLVKDEIVSVANGNIQKYDVLNETPLPDGSFATTLKAVVSVNKLTSFCESKGVSVEFKGGLFAMNMAMQELQEKNEIIAWSQIKNNVIERLLINCMDSKFDVTTPQLIRDTNYSIPINISISVNKNLENILNTIKTFCTSASIKDTASYNKISKNVFQLNIFSKQYFFRNKIVRDEIWKLPFLLFGKIIQNFRIDNGIGNYSLLDIPLVDGQFRTKILGQENKTIYSNIYGGQKRKWMLSNYNDFDDFIFVRAHDYAIKSLPHRFGLKTKNDFISYIKNGGGDGKYYGNELADASNSLYSLNCSFENLIGEFLKIELKQRISITEIKQISDYKVYMEKE